MPILREVPAHLFPSAQARTLAATLQAEDDEGWIYVVVDDPQGRGLSYIEMADETGAVVGRL